MERELATAASSTLGGQQKTAVTFAASRGEVSPLREEAKLRAVDGAWAARRAEYTAAKNDPHSLLLRMRRPHAEPACR